MTELRPLGELPGIEQAKIDFEALQPDTAGVPLPVFEKCGGITQQFDRLELITWQHLLTL